LRKTAKLQNGGKCIFCQRVKVTGIVAGKTITKKEACDAFSEWRLEKKKS
jgi:hypothetical protein